MGWRYDRSAPAEVESKGGCCKSCENAQGQPINELESRAGLGCERAIEVRCMKSRLRLQELSVIDTVKLYEATG